MSHVAPTTGLLFRDTFPHFQNGTPTSAPASTVRELGLNSQSINSGHVCISFDMFPASILFSCNVMHMKNDVHVPGTFSPVFY